MLFEAAFLTKLDEDFKPIELDTQNKGTTLVSNTRSKVVHQTFDFNKSLLFVKAGGTLTAMLVLYTAMLEMADGRRRWRLEYLR